MATWTGWLVKFKCFGLPMLAVPLLTCTIGLMPLQATQCRQIPSQMSVTQQRHFLAWEWMSLVLYDDFITSEAKWLRLVSWIMPKKDIWSRGSPVQFVRKADILQSGRVCSEYAKFKQHEDWCWPRMSCYFICHKPKLGLSKIKDWNNQKFIWHSCSSDHPSRSPGVRDWRPCPPG